MTPEQITLEDRTLQAVTRCTGSGGTGQNGKRRCGAGETHLARPGGAGEGAGEGGEAHGGDGEGMGRRPA
jgi:hypothetical protein